MNKFFKKEDVGHLYNEHYSSHNSLKGLNYTKVEKRKGYSQDFQYKLTALSTYLSPFLISDKKLNCYSHICWRKHSFMSYVLQADQFY